MKYFNSLIKIIFISLLSFNCSGKSPTEVDGYPLATPNDLPYGEEAKPGESSGVYLGHYKTCEGYAKFFKSQIGFFARTFIVPFAEKLQDFSTEDCKNSHTCHCKNNQYFKGDIPNREPLYKCIESSSTGIERDEVYQPNQSFKGEGVIKFALPHSFCKQQNLSV